MIHMARLPTPSDQPSSEPEAPLSLDLPSNASREELAKSFLAQRKEEMAHTSHIIEGGELFDRLSVKDKDFINNIQTLSNDDLEQLRLASSKIVKSHENFDHTLAEQYLKAERNDFKIGIGVRAGLLIVIGGGMALIGPVAALGFATVFVALGYKDTAQRNMHTDEFAQTRLALLEQESFKRKVQEGRSGQDPSKPASETGSTLEENLPETISIRKSTRNP